MMSVLAGCGNTAPAAPAATEAPAPVEEAPAEEAPADAAPAASETDTRTVTDGNATYTLSYTVSESDMFAGGKYPLNAGALAGQDKKDRNLAGPTAPARGLTLMEVKYN